MTAPAAATNAAATPTVSLGGWARTRRIGVGLLVGLVAGLSLVLLQGLGRIALGVPPAAELLGDRVAPLLGIPLFFRLLRLFNGYDQLKAFGVIAGSAGQVAFLVGAGALYARARWRAADGLRVRPRGARSQAATLLAGFWLLQVVVLWPVLSTSAIGLPPVPARLLTLLVSAAAVAAAGAVLVFGYDWVVARNRQAVSATAATDAGASAVDDRPVGRRAVLAAGAGLGLAAATGGVGAVLLGKRSVFDYDGLQLRGPGIQPITPNDSFYVVTKNVIDPRVAASLWRLSVTGHVDRGLSMDLAALQDRPATEQETTLMCISNSVGQGLESNAVWTGVPLADLLAEAGVRDGAAEVRLTAVDGYADTFSIDKAMDPTTLVAYRMNGVPLPRRHGYPARIIVPGLFGEKNVKWLTRIEVTAKPAEGFYERQGWGPNFVVPTRSRFTAPDFGRPLTAGHPVLLAGTAFAGDRGVQRVEVSTDGGATWADARITYAGPDTSWSLWALQWTPRRAREHTLMVRATDRTGTLQTAERRSVAPEGATGYHTVTARVTGA